MQRCGVGWREGKAKSGKRREAQCGEEEEVLTLSIECVLRLDCVDAQWCLLNLEMNVDGEGSKCYKESTCGP